MAGIPHAQLDDAKEDATYTITGVFKDGSTAIPQADLGTVRMWLKNQKDGATINGRSNLNINNTGPATIDASGNLTLTLEPDDNPIVDSTRRREVHILTIEWTWNGGAKKSHTEIWLPVRNSTHVPTS